MKYGSAKKVVVGDVITVKGSEAYPPYEITGKDVTVVKLSLHADERVKLLITVEKDGDEYELNYRFFVDPKPYYSLVIRYDGVWGVEFGSYRKKECVDEGVDLVLAEDERTKIIKTSDKQVDIDAAVVELNKQEKDR